MNESLTDIYVLLGEVTGQPVIPGNSMAMT